MIEMIISVFTMISMYVLLGVTCQAIVEAKHLAVGEEQLPPPIQAGLDVEDVAAHKRGAVLQNPLVGVSDPCCFKLVGHLEAASLLLAREAHKLVEILPEVALLSGGERLHVH